ncbi:MAG: PAS domain-containing protein [Ferrovum sp.]|nr:PAS domain-containing protein [Ferrovum sp.]NDU87409.1 PAS domain-containing protein [Ferrovum sp.]
MKPSLSYDQDLRFNGLDHLSTAIVVLDPDLHIVFINTATESLLSMGRKHLLGQPLAHISRSAAGLVEVTRNALEHELGFLEHEWTLHRPTNESVIISCSGTPLSTPLPGILLELRPISQRMRIAREEKILDDQKTNRELLRNLAHEIRNPLGGIRGAAQLLEGELGTSDLREYTQVIRDEADRLQNLMDRLLSSNRARQIAPLNIHEVLERVRTVVLAEYPLLELGRDYDPSLPELNGDREQLIQAILNITRNAAQALQGQGLILFQSRPLRQITLARRRFRLGLLIRIRDNGPGIPEDLQKRIFQPLVSGREGGSGLGLMLAQNLISQHQGLVEFDSKPGDTCFSLILPLLETEQRNYS